MLAAREMRVSIVSAGSKTANQESREHARAFGCLCVCCVNTQTRARLCLQRDEEHADALKPLQHMFAPPHLPHRGAAF